MFTIQEKARTIYERREADRRGLEPGTTEVFDGAMGAKKIFEGFKEGQRLKIYFPDTRENKAVAFVRMEKTQAIVDAYGCEGVLGHLELRVPFAWITSLEIL